MKARWLSLIAVGYMASSPAQADVITDPSGQFSVGIGANGELYDYTSNIGFLRASDGFDPLAPGEPRETWGVGNLTSTAYADTSGSQNITSTTFTNSTNTQTASSITSLGLTVNQAYSFVSPNILQINESIVNTSATTSAGLLFTRDIDWDVAPTQFNENTFAGAATGNVTQSSYYGFELPGTIVPFTSVCTFGCNQTGDLGGGITVSLGDLASGQTASVDFLYGINQSGQDVNGLLTEAAGNGAYYSVATQSSENGAYPDLGLNSAFIGVASVTSAVPEPSTWAMMLLGFGGLGFLAFSKRRTDYVAHAVGA